jgi:DNA-binding SARP family transcriptional activator/WD40 repeat protein/tRNA A-37 threonylcarbamoyl transferase component Bud32
MDTSRIPAAYVSAMEIRVLGPIEVLDSGERLDLGGRKQKTVLAMLVANAGRPVSTDRLIDAAYGDEAPDGARRSVQTYVSNLRSQMGDLITKAGAGYEFRPLESTVDTAEFERRMQAAQEMASEDPAGAASELREALALWRGHPFQDAEARSELDAEITRFNELRLVALEARVEADMATGLDRELVGELDALTTEHPLRESFHAQYMLALYRAGRQAEALRAYTRMREYLADELGIDPSPDLRQLEQRILEQDPNLALTPASAVQHRAVLVVDLAAGVGESLGTPDKRRQTLIELDRVVGNSITASKGAISAQQATATYGTFEDVRSAITAAGQISVDAPRTNGTPIVRIGVDVGDVEEEPSGLVSGPAVIRAAGLVAAANPGQVLLSSDAQAAAAADTAGGWAMRALGQHTIARLKEPETIHQLIVDGQPSQFPPLLTDVPPPELPAGRIGVPGYELREELGRGVFGTVYRAYQPSVGREVAVKVINPELANDPAFIRRFAVEAQMISRIEHPNVVPLHDFWRDPDGALLVMRLMRGGNLADYAGVAGLDREAVLRLVDQVGGALATAHSLGIAHGDVQASNVLLNESADFFLGDFGVASTSADPTERMAQELDTAALAATVDQAAALLTLSDAESELLESARRGAFHTAGEFLSAWRAEIGTAEASPTYTPTRNPYKGLAAFSELDAQDFHGRDAATDELVDAIASTRLVAAVGPSGVGKSSVVRAGLLPALRSGAVAGSAEWLVADCTPGSHPFERLASALIRVASSLPHDLEDLLRAGDRGLIKAVDRFLPPDSQLLLIVDQFEELFTLTRDEADRNQFLDLLAASVSDPAAKVRILATIRADFFDRPLRHPGFGELLRGGTVPISTPTDSEMRDIITNPAKGVGVAFESGLVERMISEVHGESGALPLVEFALTELFEQRDSDLVTLAAYEASGGVVAALGRRAEEIFSELDDHHRDAARQVFLRLVTPGLDGADTRRRVRRSELDRIGVDGDTLDGVLAAFGEPRLLTFDHDEVTRGATVEVAHEALIREWPRLEGWIDENREELVLRGRLAAAVADWEQAGRSDSYLLAGGRLTQHESWTETTELTLSSAERELLEASRVAEDERAAKRKRLRQLVLSGFAAAAVIALVLAALALNARRDADDRRLAAEQAELTAEEQASLAQAERDRAAANAELADQNAAEATTNEALAKARELAASAINVLEDDPELAILLTLQAVDETPAGQDQPAELINALWRAGQANRLVDVIDPGHEGDITIDLSNDGERLAVASPQGAAVEMFDALTGDRLWQYSPETSDSIEMVAIRPDGGLVAATAINSDSGFAAREFVGVDDLPARVVVLDGDTGSLVASLDYPQCPGGGLATWSADGSYLALVPTPDGCVRDGAPDGIWVEVWDAATWQPVAFHAFEGFDRVLRPQFDDRGQLYVFDLWDSPTVFDQDFEVVGTVEAAEGFGAVSPDGTLLAAATGENPFIGIYDANTGMQIDSLTPVDLPPSIPIGLRFSHDGERVLVAFEGDDSRIWNVRSGELEFQVPGGAATTVDLDAARDRFYTANSGVIKVWDLDSTPPGVTVSGDLSDAPWVNGNSFAIGPELGAFNAISFESGEPTWYVRFFDLTTGQLMDETVLGSAPVPLSDGRFAFESQDTTLIAYDPSTGESQYIYGCPTEDYETCSDSGEDWGPYTYAASRDGSQLLVADWTTGNMTYLDAQTGAVVSETPGDQGRISIDGFSDDRLYIARGDAEAVAIDRSTGAELWTMKGIRHAQFAPSGSTAAIVTADGTLTMLDLTTWEEEALNFGFGRVRGIAFGPDEEYLAVGDESNLHILDLRQDVLLQTIPIPLVSDVHWTDDTTIVFGTREGLWGTLSLDPVDLIEANRANLRRSLTDQECLTYRIDPCPTG